MICRTAIALAALMIALPLQAQPTTGPIIADYGAAFVVDNADRPLKDDHVYKVVFEITGYDNPGGLNRNLDRVARFLNLHAKNGVAPENIQAAVVLHGAALVNALNEESYQTRFDSENPNRDIAEALSAAGVQFFVCGQSMGGRGVGKEELAEPFRLATSALTMVHELQAEGYTLQP